MRSVAGAALVLAVLLPGACRRDPRVRAGAEVVMHYELSVSGTVRESTFHGRPVTIVQGRGDVPPGVDAALLTMAPGEEKRLTLAPEAAFGGRDAGRVQTLPLKKFGALGADLKPGKKVSGFRDGQAQSGVVLSVGGGQVVVDFNHPLAGQTVVYRVRVVSTGE